MSHDYATEVGDIESSVSQTWVDVIFVLQNLLNALARINSIIRPTI
jgi:hypothetical protein